MPYNFQYVEAQKVQLTNDEIKQLRKLYEQWAKDIEKEWGNKVTSTASGAVKKTQMLKLRSALRREAKYIAEATERDITSSLYVMSNHVVDAMYANLAELGVNSKLLRASFASIPTNVVENLVNGSIYGAKGSWSLSKAIWGDEEKTLSNLYKIVAGGIAENKSIYEIANELSKYVNPRAARQWNLKTKDGVRIYPKKVDYAAQRLARTLSQHAYQQTIVQTTLKNPMVLGIRWRANGSRVCEVCKARDGQVFLKDQLPLDHPNGMCVMEPIYLADSDDMIAKWVNSPAGTYPSMDEWAKELGYEFDGNNPSTPIVNIMRNEDNKSVAKQSYKNDQPFNSKEWLDDEATAEFDSKLDDLRKQQKSYIGGNNTIRYAVEDYTGNTYYRELNAWLRGDKSLDEISEWKRGRIKSLSEDLSKAMDGSKIPDNMYIHRKGSYEEFADLLGVSDSTLRRAERNEELIEELNGKLSGMRFEVDGYMSTHTKFGNFWGDMEFFIKTNDDTHGMYVTEFSGYGSDEDEILLNKGTKFEVKSIEQQRNRMLRVYVEIVK